MDLINVLYLHYFKVLLWVTSYTTCTIHKYDAHIIPAPYPTPNVNPKTTGRSCVKGGEGLIKREACRFIALVYVRETVVARLAERRRACREGHAISFVTRFIQRLVLNLSKMPGAELELKFTRLSEHAFAPMKGSEKAAGFDLKRMLPSTGYFKGNSCPFYDNGLCERPYCHFRHVKKESQNINNDGIESGAILQKLVSAAVQKVLLQKEASGTATVTQPENTVNVVQSVAKVTYNPTPISELNKINNPVPEENNEEVVEQRKRHIPVPYTPRKPAGLPLQRPIDTNGASKPFIYIPPPLKYTPGSTENVKCDKYTPTGSTVSTEKYLPGSETELQQYNPNEGSNNSSKHNYVPSDKNTSKKKILEYKPTKVSSKSEIPSVTYQPTPRSLAPCFSSDEDEPENKKKKLSSDLNGFDDLGPEFDILDQILDEEKSDQDKIKKDSSDSSLKKCYQ
ncbi:hypothetical protein HW555_006276 [Spodoptera exigua]|uniref:C3H1-type domain-containing protein n=1 Tax=Spodoptera exigua TaxID=7107 RepID=A0A835GEW3_SPOEX|nr:hypothetical protein HW555_006276 [Spodoptera exigua]